MKGRGVFRLGEIQTIQYKTSFTNYTIALWQQSLTEGAATIGPIVYQTTNGPDNGFAWVVQNYDLSLRSSNVFFFWLFEGGPSMQGNQSAHQIVSSFFNITNAPPPPTTTTSSISTSSTALYLPATSTTALSTASITTSITTSATAATSAAEHALAAGGLSTGATAGIGVGVGLGVVGLASIAGAIFLVKRRRTRAEGHSQIVDPGSKDYPVDMTRGWNGSYPAQSYPMETGISGRHQPVAELG
ncbi:hypothetical protein PT974_05026 [Cladobotryum mycophilum]|uniref:Mid2 domain-containing protein n=1 Tax=Cladobotryum mycophilum TaxID=491253 RepID=A0ABR0SR16_9HYPO